MTDHHPHPAGPAGSVGSVVLMLSVVTLLAAAAAYLWLARRARQRNPVRGWSRWRCASFLAGLVVLAAALLPPVDPWSAVDFRGHMTQHLLIGMYAPLALVLGAPATLLLRTLRPDQARWLVARLHSRAVRPLAHPGLGLVLSVGGLGALYFTPLYRAATADPAGHWLLHAHFLASGCLFANAIAGPDPAPARPPVRARLVYLGVAITAHAVMAQLMYGGVGIQIDAPVSQVRGAAEIMYYGGDLAELLLAAALVATWRPRRVVSRKGPLLTPSVVQGTLPNTTAGPPAPGRVSASRRPGWAAYFTAPSSMMRRK